MKQPFEKKKKLRQNFIKPVFQKKLLSKCILILSKLLVFTDMFINQHLALKEQYNYFHVVGVHFWYSHLVLNCDLLLNFDISNTDGYLEH